MAKAKVDDLIYIPEAELCELLNDREHMRKQIKDLQKRGDELVESNRSFQRTIVKMQAELVTLVGPPGDPPPLGDWRADREPIVCDSCGALRGSKHYTTCETHPSGPV